MARLTADVYPHEGGFVSNCPEAATFSQGYTVEEAVAMLQDATQLFLEINPNPDITLPITVDDFDVVVHSGEPQE